VEGIYKTSNTLYDEMNAFVRNEDLRRLIDLEESAGHEMAVLLSQNDMLDAIIGTLRENLPGLDCKTWREIMPEVSLVEESTDLSMYIFMGIILAALVFGIVNTMLMAVLERIKELGMLMAIGMNKLRVFAMILLETMMLSLCGGIVGIVTGYLVTVIYSHRGINLARYAEAYERLGYESMIYPVASLDIDLRVTLMILLTGIIASLYPAWKAIQLKPAEALRIDI
jgi:ABC-type lipoprotein release transport system permease subunit